ncbi:MAG: serine/threonine-protein phosphatase [Acidobacteria bacterium]|nr:serine/threonine-protein phosphatase [Acidobacteriota bacterium]
MFSFTGISNVGCVRQNNEDSLLLAPELGLYAVADGMGGAQAGEVASRMAVAALKESLQEATVRDLEALKEAVQHANRAILEASSDPSLKGMGTTLTCLLESSEGWLVAHVGDSRAWRVRGGRLEQLSFDQTWVNEIGRPLGLSEEALKQHPMRHVLTMAMGVGSALRMQVERVDFAEGDLILLSSDGLHGPVSEEKLLEILLRPITLDERAHYLIEAAREAGGPDNITVVLLER